MAKTHPNWKREVPPNPGAWLTTTANRNAIDRIRRENKRDDKQKEAQMVYDDDPPEPLGVIDDERLRLIFTCCHRALAMQTRVALTLRMVGGLTVPEIASPATARSPGHPTHPGDMIAPNAVPDPLLEIRDGVLTPGRSGLRITGRDTVVGPLTTGVPEILERNPGGGVGSGQRRS